MAKNMSTALLGARPLLAAALLFAVVGAPNADPLAALPPVLGATEIFVSDELSGLALRGFDPVSYHLGSTPRPGQAGFEHIWSGVVWRFANEANRDAFEREPAAYAPRLGGYDATRAAEGTLLAADPSHFVLRAARLYVFRDQHARTRFIADPSIETRAEERWPELTRNLVRP